MTKEALKRCWVCGHDSLQIVKESDFGNKDDLDIANFKITNSDYGKTGELSKCPKCGFIQCTKESDVIHFYEDLVDTAYEDTRGERKLQEISILRLIQKIKPSGKLLDIGAGSGIMVESALEMGYDAEGIEPSKWLQKQADKRSLPIHLGTFPMEGLSENYDIIALVDVIEHVNNPKELLSEINRHLNNDGIFIVITPDVESLTARFLKWKWWHFRVAHIGYFSKKTLTRIAMDAGFEQLKMIRPSWYFRIEYLAERAYQYLPKILRIPLPRFLKKIILPVNLRDSLLVIYKKQSIS